MNKKINLTLVCIDKKEKEKSKEKNNVKNTLLNTIIIFPRPITTIQQISLFFYYLAYFLLDTGGVVFISSPHFLSKPFSYTPVYGLILL